MTTDSPPPNSSIANNYVSYLNKSWRSATTWLDSKRYDDNAEGLWRIYDELYDLSSFVKFHPGGPDWLTLTKGTDITEAYETHHFNFDKTNAILQKYHVRKAALPRNMKLTFEENGFYKTLKRRVVDKLNETNVKRTNYLSNLMSDFLVFATFACAILSTHNPIFVVLASLMLAWTTIAGHNYTHRRDNFRMKYFNFGFLSYREFRVSHALSHHLYTNSLADMEVLVLEPVICWLPNPKIKTFVNRYVAWLYGPIVWSLFFVADIIARIIGYFVTKENLINVADLIPFALPTVMYVFGASDFVGVLKLWGSMLLLGSFFFTITGIHAGHHHPEAFHDGDAARTTNMDWGIFQVDSMVERRDIQGNHFMVLTNFGDHALHHLFPTLDHGLLNDLYPLLYETMEEFKVDLRFENFFQLVRGQHRQVARITSSDRLKDL